MSVELARPFAGACETPWMPETARRLASAEWNRLDRALGLGRENYGTARIHGRSQSAPRTVAGHVALPAECGHRTPVVIEYLDPANAAKYVAMGLEFASVAEVELADASSRLASALAALSSVPDLAVTVATLLGAIHVLRSPSADHDVSHSDPGVPFSVFVGVPAEAGPLDRLRLAEELVHECMHLLLTLLEAERPLIRGTEELHESPWQGRLRPTQGVLHGFYVFSVLDVLFARLAAAACLSGAEATHVRLRRREIEAELALAAGALETSEELTRDGRDLVAELRPATAFNRNVRDAGI